MSRPRLDPLLPTTTLAAMLLTLAAIAVPHALRLPFWISLLALACGGWRYLRAVRGESLPPTWLRVLLTVTVVGGIYAHYDTLLGLEAGTALLVSMTALKLLEMRARRDTHVVLYLGFLLIGMQFLFSQTLPNLIYLIVSVWAMLMLLISAHRATGHGKPWQYARLSGALVLQAIPVAAVLFLLFPRVSGPLWRMPDEGHAQTGLSDTMSPGSVSQLSQSDAVAFRVEFDGDIPPPSQRYWRALVLTHYDGYTWSRMTPRTPPPQLDHVPVEHAYDILLEPHGQQWLPALEMATRAGNEIGLTALYELRSRNPLDERLNYRLRSSPHYRLQAELPPNLRQAYLMLPDASAKQAKELAQKWRADSNDPRDILRRARDYFVQREFVYTLSPPRLPRDPVDQFLFETQRGFCEHYAGAFAVLMRAAGVPARVVTGYQGGELNPIGEYLIVRQSDAHAWVEIWMDGEGWLRIDPTAWVSPNRIEQGLASALPAGEPIPFLARPDSGLLKALELRWDALNNGWNRWVLGYNPSLQRSVLSRLGLDNLFYTALALAASIALIVLTLTLILLLQGRRRGFDPLAAAYERFCRKLARAGLERRHHEGPADFARRVVAARPDLAEPVRAITKLYIDARYGAATPSDAPRKLRRLITTFRP